MNFDVRAAWREKAAADPTDWEAAYEVWANGADGWKQTDEARWAFEEAYKAGRESAK